MFIAWQYRGSVCRSHEKLTIAEMYGEAAPTLVYVSFAGHELESQVVNSLYACDCTTKVALPIYLYVLSRHTVYHNVIIF
jgi:hypothetical protein